MVGMLQRNNLHQYQVKTVGHIMQHEQCMLHQAMGLGKTIATLTAIADLFDTLSIKAVLIVAPLRVCQTVWRQEAAKWNHTKWLRFSLIHGNADKRMRAVRRQANVYLINFENLKWLQDYMETVFLKQGRYLPFDMVVYDEISKLKNARTRQGTNRGKAAMKMLPFIRRRVGLTGTPASNGLLDLFGQYLVVDGGQRLGSSFEAYRTQYFYQTDRAGYRYAPFEHTPERIASVIGDVTISMSAEDYLDMPNLITNDIMLKLPQSHRGIYDAIEKEMIVELQSGRQVEVFNQASLVNRTLQYANGAIYTEPGGSAWEQIHDIKLDALEEIVEESAGQPILVAFEFRHDAAKIMKRFKDAVWFSSDLTEKEAVKAIEDFREGRLRMLIGHPASMGHGLDRLQQAGHIVVWYGLNWSLDLYDQTIARLWRQGQTQPVIVHRLLMDDTTDLVVREALTRKASDETTIKSAIMDYWNRKAA